MGGLRSLEAKTVVCNWTVTDATEERSSVNRQNWPIAGEWNCGAVPERVGVGELFCSGNSQMTDRAPSEISREGVTEAPGK